MKRSVEGVAREIADAAFREASRFVVGAFTASGDRVVSRITAEITPSVAKLMKRRVRKGGG